MRFSLTNTERRGYQFPTIAIHAGEGRDPATNAHNTPIYQTATFSFETAEEKAHAMETGGHFYSRTSNPTTTALEVKLAALEGAEEAIVTASGMAAVSMSILSSAGSGDHLIVANDVFVITRQFLESDCPEMGIEVTFVDITDLDAVRQAVRPTTRAIFTEFVSNPHIEVADVPALSNLARQHGLTFIVDNTFISPYLFQPLDHGADLVVHSATKYLSGHGDTIAGVIAGRSELIGPLRLKVDAFGGCLSPFNAWLVLRGVRTLDLRMDRHSANGLALARFLERQPDVELVNYPGLEGHPQHELARQLLGDRFGGMMSIRLEGDTATMNAFANRLQLCDLGVSLGDLYTLVYPQPKRDNLIRISVGCEHVDDIIADFEQALEGSS